MRDDDCVAFLRWALPRMGLHWPGFRKVRGIVCKRIDRRLRALGIATSLGYREFLDDHAGEWEQLRSLCSIPISRFYRDRTVFAAIEDMVLPALATAAQARGDHALSCWSVGCASGEEPYTLSILWQLRLAARFPTVDFRVLASDMDSVLLNRAAAGCYPRSSLAELPHDLDPQAFEAHEQQYCIKARFRAGVEFEQRDILESVPGETFDLVSCRNVVLTYFDLELQREVLRRILDTLRPGGAFVVGIHESPPAEIEGLAPWPGTRCIFAKGGAVPLTPSERGSSDERYHRAATPR